MTDPKRVEDEPTAAELRREQIEQDAREAEESHRIRYDSWRQMRDEDIRY